MDSTTTAQRITKAPKYMACVDHRPESHVALRLACMKAKTRGGAVTMVHVVAPADFQTLGAIADRMKEERRREGEELLSSLADQAFSLYGVRPHLMLREGSSGEEIINASLEDHEIIMMVIGIASQNSGRGRLAAWLAGQLGHRLLTPLLMVQGNLTEEQLQSLV